VDIFTTAEPPIRPLGRDTDLTQASFNDWMPRIAGAPHVFSGVSDTVQVSPPLGLYCPGGFDNQWVGMCFPASTPVRMADGSERVIEDVSVGDKVVTHASGSRSVVDTFSRKYSGDMFTIRTARSLSQLQATADHPFAVRHGDGIRWVKAGDLAVGDELVISSSVPSEGVTQLDALDYIDDAFSDHALIAGESCNMQKPEVARKAILNRGFYDPNREKVRLFQSRYKNSVYRYITVDAALARLVGLYLAEGNIDGDHRVCWTFHINETEFADEVVRLVRECFGVTAEQILGPEGRNTRFVRVDNSVFTTFWHKFVPGNCATKRVPACLMAGNDDVRFAVLSGWYAGDGCSRLKKMAGSLAAIMVGVTTSTGLVRDMLTLSTSLGLRSTANARTRVAKRRPAFDLCFSGKKAHMLEPAFAQRAAAAGVAQTERGGSPFFRFGQTAKVKSISRIAVVDLPVYDFEVEEDHSFIAAGLAVHNCVGKSSKNGAATFARIPENCVYDPDDSTKSTPPLPNVRLSGLYCYLNARRKAAQLGYGANGAPNDPNGGGAVVACSMLAMEELGVVLESIYPDSQQNQQSCSDSPLPAAMYAAGKAHLLLKALRITSRQQFLDYMAAGHVVVDGVPIGSGWMQTADDGKFSLGGKIVGGHATLKVQYNMRENWIKTRNSWVGWGARTDDPQFAGDAGGSDLIGYCPLDQYLDMYYTDDKLQNGSTDAFVIVDVAAFAKPAPRIKLFSNTDVFA
jgi:intein/homing endonuclease